MNTKHLSRGAAAALMALALAACQSLQSNKAKGAIVGAAVGGAAGAAIGNANGSTAKGAIIGATVGGVVGTIIGHQMDQQAKELEQNIPGAIVERVGEGIQVTFPSGLLFDFDSDRIKADAATNLRNLASSLDKYPNSSLLIVGHTDATGTDDYNLGLSERRARSAAQYLANQGVTASRLQTVGRGEREPVASNDTETGMQKNRRVEVAIYASDAYRNSLKSQYKSGL
ncbi:MAG TPA: OmpA family protein [Gemmatimonadaceae bacterium]|nr:OmpA family protein [Gemmatimonadaceae bacterium]